MFAVWLFEWLFLGRSQPAEWAHASAILHTLGTYAGIIVANASLLLAWALYNQIRFRGRERRRFAPLVTCADLAEMYGFPVSSIDEWQNASILVAHLDADGRLVEMQQIPRPEPEASILS